VPPAYAVGLARAAGRHPAVRHFDVMELCPVHDEGDRTARLAALLVLAFLAGLAERPA
jgi:formiminoglutamase/guanidinobutyrase